MREIFGLIFIQKKTKIDKVIFYEREKDKNKCIIQIKDDGCGMDEQTKEKIFNPFFTTKPVGQGTGLGLSISYKIIQSHNGQITVNSKLNEGTTFNIELPINQLQQKVNI